MPAVRNLGLFSRALFCPREENNDLLDNTYADIWIQNKSPFIYACAHYWRVKTWQVSASATWTEVGGGTGFSASFSDTVSQGINREYFTYEDGSEDDTESGTTPTSEIELVCNDPTVSHRLFRFVGASGGSGLSVEYNYFVDNIAAQSPAIFRLDGDGNVSEVKTPIRFSADTLRWQIESYPFSGNTGTYGELEYTLLGETFTAPLHARNSLGSGDLSISASLTAEEYWPYDPGDGGGPIYDSATGQQLRAFSG